VPALAAACADALDQNPMLVFVGDILFKQDLSPLVDHLAVADIVVGVADAPPAAGKRYTCAKQTAEGEVAFLRDVDEARSTGGNPVVGAYAFRSADRLREALLPSEPSLTRTIQALRKTGAEVRLAALGTCLEVNTPKDRRTARSQVARWRNEACSPMAAVIVSYNADPCAWPGTKNNGGQNVVVRESAKGLAALGWDVCVVTRWQDQMMPEREFLAPRCEVVRIEAGPKQTLRRLEHSLYVSDFSARLGDFFSKLATRPSVIHTHYWHSALALSQCVFPEASATVHTNHSLAVLRAELPDVDIEEGRAEVEAAVLRQAKLVLATCTEEVRVLRAAAPEGRLAVLPCGVDVERFRPRDRRDARRRLGFDARAKILLFVARPDPRKGFEIALETLPYLESCRLVVVGDYDRDERWRGLVDKRHLSDQVEFVGQVPPQVLPLYFASADVCISPSLYEPFGLVALEAQSCGVPVVARGVGGD